ncbi:MAG: hypothetical protein JSV18_02475 [Candidatus Bathyarchaeota archaeon]|nr:MAG: hypothetical protein JSV18_02475 [Candidatus Bathyarchaeota archaeon]
MVKGDLIEGEIAGLEKLYGKLIFLIFLRISEGKPHCKGIELAIEVALEGF